MKLLHTADWHLGNAFYGYDREAEFKHYLAWLRQALAEQQPDVLLIAGDVFDHPNPSAEAEKMFFRFLCTAAEEVSGLQIVVIAGNHDSGARLEAPAGLLYLHNIYVRGTIERLPDGTPDFDRLILPLSRRDNNEAEVVCFAVPYLRSGDYPAGMTQEEGLRYYFEQLWKHLRKSDFRGLPVIPVAHYYAADARLSETEHSERLVVGGQDRVEGDVAGRDAAYIALGHIHRAQEVREHTFYAGSILPMSFSEKYYDHGAQLIELDEQGRAAVSRLTYTPLRQLKSIPEKGAASAGEVLDLISRLPHREKNDEGLGWPYLELRVREEQPEPQFLHDVTNALQTKAVRFCRILREQPEAPNAERSMPDVVNVTTTTPLELAQQVFQDKYGKPLPEALQTRFAEAAEDVITDRHADQ